jgi:ribosomal-protein-alanine N-acetyltransferase
LKLELRPPEPSQPRRLDITTMNAADIPAVLRIEGLSFTTAWPTNAFWNEIHDNKLAHYYIGRFDDRIVAYGGIWVILDDSHITTIAAHPDVRGRKIGEEMLLFLIEDAIARGASWMTLEVRESNESAQNLYKKYGFTVVSTRRAYYSDNNENALVMWAGNLKGELYQNRLRALRSLLDQYIARERR